MNLNPKLSMAGIWVPVDGLLVTSAIFIQLFMQSQFCRNAKFNRGFSCVLFAAG